VLGRFIKPVYLGLRGLGLKVFVRSDRGLALPQHISSLLVITDSRLGDVCLAIPVLQSLRSAYPQANFAVVLPQYLHGLVQWSCRPDIVFDGRDARIRQQARWDVAIDLSTDYFLKPAQLAWHSGARVRIGFDYSDRGVYFTHPIAAPPPDEHAQVTYTKVLDALGIPFKRTALPSLTGNAATAVNSATIAVHPGAHHPTQRWPAEHFAELIKRIQRGGEHCMVLGSSREKDLVSTVARLAMGATCMITDDVLELAAVLQNSSMLICNNSGPLHLAGLLGIPTLSFMGPTVKSRWWPLGSDAIVLRRDDLLCIGCNLGYCKIRTHACMKEITAEQAFAAYNRRRIEVR